MAPYTLWLSLTALVGNAAAITALPPQTASTNTNTVTGAASLAPVSHSYTYTVTTPTTAWYPPTFATATAAPCAESMCPGLNGQSCADTQNVTYGILCQTMFSGIVITNSGRKFLLERAEHVEQMRDEVGRDEARAKGKKRDFSGSFEGCVDFCDTFTKSNCGGVAYAGGYCMAYDLITGSFHSDSGVAALRQN